MGYFLEKESFQKCPFVRDLRSFRDSRGPPECGNKGESNPWLEILENLEILEVLHIPPAKRPLPSRPPFPFPNQFKRPKLPPKAEARAPTFGSDLGKGIVNMMTLKHVQVRQLGKTLMGAHKRGLKAQIFRENRAKIPPRKLGLFRVDRAFQGLSGRFWGRSGPLPPHLTATGREEIAPKGPFLAQLAPFGPSPCLLIPV